MEDRSLLGILCWRESDSIHAFNLPPVEVCDSSSVAIPLVESSQLDSTDSSVHGVQPRCKPDTRHFVSRRPTAVPEAPCSLGKVFVVCRYHAAVTTDSHVLAGVERKTSSQAKRSNFSSVVICTMGLAGVLHYTHVAFLGQRQKLLHSGWLPIEMHRQNDSRLRRYLFRRFSRVQIESEILDIRKPWLRTSMNYRVRCCEERKGSCQNLVVILDPD